MALPALDPTVLGRVADNAAILGRIAAGSAPAPDGRGPWSPDGYVMRTHPDLGEALERAAAGTPASLRIVLGLSALALPDGLIVAVAWGTSRVWLRVDSGPAFDDAVAGDADPVPGLTPWVSVDAWRVDLGRWVRASLALAARRPPRGPARRRRA